MSQERERDAERSGAVEKEVAVARRLRRETWGGGRGGGGMRSEAEQLHLAIVINF